MQTTQRQYDVYRVTRGGVIWMAKNVNHEEAIMTMAITLAAYDDSWQIQPENPRGMVKVLDSNSGDYHMLILIETETSRERQEAVRMARVAENKSNWLVSYHPLDMVHANTDNLNTPVDGYVTDYREGADAVDGEEAQSA